jgi:hypothetical protein
MALLWRMNVHTTNGEAARDMVIAGLGIGSMMQVFLLSVQNAVERPRMGAATALTQFGRQMGATIGVALMGVIVNAGLRANASTDAGLTVRRLPPALRVSLAAALKPAFLATMCVALLVWVVAVLYVKEVRLLKEVDEISAAEAAAGALSPGLSE